MSVQPNELDTLVPFPAGTLSPEHRQEITKIRSCLQAWLTTIGNARKEPSEKDKVTAAMDNLSNLKVDAPYAFTPPPPYKYRSVLLSCTKCYWLALIASLTDDKKKELAKRLEAIPPYGKRVPQFNGKRCVEQAGDLKQNEYEGLMRTAIFVAMGLSSDTVVKMWRELAEVGVQTWEERD